MFLSGSTKAVPHRVEEMVCERSFELSFVNLAVALHAQLWFAPKLASLLLVLDQLPIR